MFDMFSSKGIDNEVMKVVAAILATAEFDRHGGDIVEQYKDILEELGHFVYTDRDYSEMIDYVKSLKYTIDEDDD